MASNVDRRVSESPLGWRQNSEPSNTRITAPGDLHVLALPLPTQRNSLHRLDAPHCLNISGRTTLSRFHGWGAPANEKSHARSASRTLSCQAATSASGTAKFARCHGLVSSTSTVMFWTAGSLSSLVPHCSSTSWPRRKSHAVRPATMKWSRPPMARHSGRWDSHPTRSRPSMSRDVVLFHMYLPPSRLA
nr:unnamed protein product [Digitaria exilis]